MKNFIKRTKWAKKDGFKKPFQNKKGCLELDSLFLV